MNENLDRDRSTGETREHESSLVVRNGGAAWQAPALHITSGVFGRYAALVSSAAEGAVLSTPGA